MKLSTTLAAAIATVVLLPGSAGASPGPKHVDRDYQSCVTMQEWKDLADRLNRGRHPTAAIVEAQWEVVGLGWDTVLDLSAFDGFGTGITTRAYPRCGFEGRPTEAWWGFATDEYSRVVTATGYQGVGVTLR